MSGGAWHGFVRGRKGRHAEDAITRAESLIAVLKLEEIDLATSEALVRRARRALAAHDYARASGAALQAEGIALKLEERYRGYERALEAVKARLEEGRRYGLPVKAMEAAINRADDQIAVGTWEAGFKLADYETARTILEDAERDGQALVEKAASAGNAVFLADLAIEALLGVPGPRDRDAFEAGAAEALENALEGATRRLALHEYDQAARIARDIEARATRMRAEFIEATEALAVTSALLGELRAKGVHTERLGNQVGIARGVLRRGVIDPAAAMARRLLEDARSAGDAFAKATGGVADATNRYTALVREGHLSATADRAILDARRAIREGEYVAALRHLEDAEQAIIRAEADRAALAKSLEERRKRTVPASTPFFPEAQEILGRAEKEFMDGDYSSSSEDLVLANLLLGPGGARTGGSKG